MVSFQGRLNTKRHCFPPAAKKNADARIGSVDQPNRQRESAGDIPQQAVQPAEERDRKVRRHSFMVMGVVIHVWRTCVAMEGCMWYWQMCVCVPDRVYGRLVGQRTILAVLRGPILAVLRGPILAVLRGPILAVLRGPTVREVATGGGFDFNGPPEQRPAFG